MRMAVHVLAAAYGLVLIVLLAMPLGTPSARAWAASHRSFLSVSRPVPLRPLAKDLTSNVAVFVPLGILGVLSARRLGVRPGLAVAVVVGSSVLLSLTMECVQYFVPGRHSSLLDVAMNVFGTAGGSVVAVAADRARPAR